MADAMDSTALLLLDLQRDFLDANGRMPVGTRNADLVIASANRLLVHAERVGWTPIPIRNEFRKEDWIGNLLRKGSAIEGSSGAEIDPRVQLPASVSTLPKSKSDAFSNPALGEMLARARIRRIVILGVMAEGCVRTTVWSARNGGLSVTVVSDGIASSREFLKRLAVMSMHRAGARLEKCDKILSYA